MKKLLMLLVLCLLLCSVAFAMGGSGGTNDKCSLKQWSCGFSAFSSCVEAMKYYDPNMPRPGGLGGWTVDPNTPEFKACEVEKKAKCLQDSGC